MSLRDELKENNFVFKKQFGQNFISDKNLLSSIVDIANITKHDFVLEIGAGAGTLTQIVAQRAKKVVAIEIDSDLKDFLSHKFENSNVELIFTDVMRLDEETIEKIIPKDYHIIANLPYYITSAIVMKFLELKTPPKSMTLMMQKEVAERFTALHSTKEYGAITAIIDLYGDVAYAKTVTRDMFFPKPDVDSAVVRLDVIENKYDVDDKEFVKKIIKSAFSKRRKTLINNINADFGIEKNIIENILRELDLDSKIRGENLTTLQFIQLSKIIKNA